VIGRREALSGLSPEAFTDERFGVPTVRDIFVELEKPGRDPRGDFVTASFREGVEKLSDLEPGMVLEGVVTNVANFGAFVDIGVHQDGLVHISALSSKFVRDPREVVKAGQLVRVKVLEVDVQRQRVALTMRLEDEPGRAAGAGAPGAPGAQGARGQREPGRGGRPQGGGRPAGGGQASGGGQSPAGGRPAGGGRGPQVPTAMQNAFAALKKR